MKGNRLSFLLPRCRLSYLKIKQVEDNLHSFSHICLFCKFACENKQNYYKPKTVIRPFNGSILITACSLLLFIKRLLLVFNSQ